MVSEIISLSNLFSPFERSAVEWEDREKYRERKIARERESKNEREREKERERDRTEIEERGQHLT